MAGGPWEDYKAAAAAPAPAPAAVSAAPGPWEDYGGTKLPHPSDPTFMDKAWHAFSQGLFTGEDITPATHPQYFNNQQKQEFEDYQRAHQTLSQDPSTKPLWDKMFGPDAADTPRAAYWKTLIHRGVPGALRAIGAVVNPGAAVPVGGPAGGAGEALGQLLTQPGKAGAAARYIATGVLGSGIVEGAHGVVTAAPNIHPQFVGVKNAPETLGVTANPDATEQALSSASQLAASVAGAKAAGMPANLPEPIRNAPRALLDTAADATAGARTGVADVVQRAAERNLEKVLGATTDKLKTISAEKVVPGMIERGITANTRTGLTQLAERAADFHGEQVQKRVDAATASGVELQVAPIISRLQAIKQHPDYSLNSTKPLELWLQQNPGKTEEEFNRTTAEREAPLAQVDRMVSTLKKYGKTITPTDLVQVRRFFDDEVARKKGAFLSDENKSYEAHALESGTNIIRDVINTEFPDIASSNNEFSFYNNLRTVMKATEKRTAGQNDSLGRAGRMTTRGIVGGAIGSLVGAGPEAGVGAGEVIGAIHDTPAYRTRAAQLQSWLADHIRPEGEEEAGPGTGGGGTSLKVQPPSGPLPPNRQLPAAPKITPPYGYSTPGTRGITDMSQGEAVLAEPERGLGRDPKTGRVIRVYKGTGKAAAEGVTANEGTLEPSPDKPAIVTPLTAQVRRQAGPPSFQSWRDTHFQKGEGGQWEDANGHIYTDERLHQMHEAGETPTYTFAPASKSAAPAPTPVPQSPTTLAPAAEVEPKPDVSAMAEDEYAAHRQRKLDAIQSIRDHIQGLKKVRDSLGNIIEDRRRREEPVEVERRKAESESEPGGVSSSRSKYRSTVPLIARNAYELHYPVAPPKDPRTIFRGFVGADGTRIGMKPKEQFHDETAKAITRYTGDAPNAAMEALLKTGEWARKQAPAAYEISDDPSPDLLHAIEDDIRRDAEKGTAPSTVTVDTTDGRFHTMPLEDLMQDGIGPIVDSIHSPRGRQGTHLSKQNTALAIPRDLSAVAGFRRGAAALDMGGNVPPRAPASQWVGYLKGKGATDLELAGLKEAASKEPGGVLTKEQVGELLKTTTPVLVAVPQKTHQWDKFTTKRLPKDNYEEIVVTDPLSAFTTSHFDDVLGYVGHVRRSEITVPNSGRAMLIEEMQTDLVKRLAAHQKTAKMTDEELATAVQAAQDAYYSVANKFVAHGNRRPIGTRLDVEGRRLQAEQNNAYNAWMELRDAAKLRDEANNSHKLIPYLGMTDQQLQQVQDEEDNESADIASLVKEMTVDERADILRRMHTSGPLGWSENSPRLVKSWEEAALRETLVTAANRGLDWVLWTPAKTQGRRWMSKAAPYEPIYEDKIPGVLEKLTGEKKKTVNVPVTTSPTIATRDITAGEIVGASHKFIADVHEGNTRTAGLSVMDRVEWARRQITQYGKPRYADEVIVKKGTSMRDANIAAIMPGGTFKRQSVTHTDRPPHQFYGIRLTPEIRARILKEAGAADPNTANWLARTGDGKVRLGADVKALGEILSSSLYQHDPGHVITKELLQNAYDAVRHLPKGEGRVNINIDAPSNTVTVKDNGKGMTRQELETVFTDLGASGKREDEGASGGFGLAKAAPLLMSKQLQVDTVTWEHETGKPGAGLKKMWRHSMTITPDDLMGEGVEIRSVPVDHRAFQTGTTIKAVGKDGVKLGYDAAAFVDTAVKSIRPPAQLTGNYNPGAGSYRDPKNWSTPSSTDEADSSLDLLAKEDIPGAQVEIFKSKDKVTEMDKAFSQLSIEVNNNGVFQFTHGIFLGETAKLPGMPLRIAVDIHPTVKEGHVEYPFTANREELRGAVKTHINNVIQEQIIQPKMDAFKKLVQETYNNLPKDKSGNVWYDAGGRLTPEDWYRLMEDPDVAKLTKIINRVTQDTLARLKELKFEYPKRSWSKEGENHLGAGIERTGIVLSDKVHGVNITGPSGKKTILLNPFAAGGGDLDPASMGSLMWHVIKHEIVHDSVGGHNESFTIGETKISQALGGRFEANQIQKLGYAYGPSLESEYLHPGISAAMDTYEESRRRPASTADVLGGEELGQGKHGPGTGPEGGDGGGVRKGGTGNLAEGDKDGDGTQPGDDKIAPARSSNRESGFMRMGDWAFAQPNPQGLVSTLEQAIEKKMPNRATPEQVLAIIRAGGSGVSPAEVKWTGIEKWLQEQGKSGGMVNKEQVKEYLRQNRVGLHEIEKGGGTTTPPPLDWRSADDDPHTLTTPMDPNGAAYAIEVTEDGEYVARVMSREGQEMVENHTFHTMEAAKTHLEEIRENWHQQDMKLSGKATKYDEYQPPGLHTNYREMLFTRPSKVDPDLRKAFKEAADKYASAEKAHNVFRDEMAEKYGNRAYSAEDGERATELYRAVNDAYDTMGQADKALDAATPPSYQSSHWNEKDVVAHTRIRDQEVDNKPTLHMVEVQSDWAKEERKRHAAGGELTPAEWDRYNNLYAQEAGGRQLNPDEREELARLQRRSEVGKGTSAAPLLDRWHEFVTKRLFHKALTEKDPQTGKYKYSGFSWTTGRQQAELYNLRRVIDELEYRPKDGGGWHITARRTGENQYSKDIKDDKELEEFVGRDIAKRIVAGEGEGRPAPKNVDPDASDDNPIRWVHQPEVGPNARTEGAIWVAQLGDLNAVVYWDPDVEGWHYNVHNSADDELDYSGEPMDDLEVAKDRAAESLEYNTNIDDDPLGHGQHLRNLPPNARILRGVELDTGGQWAKHLYDEMIPQVVNRWAKRFGGRVKDGSTPTERTLYFQFTNHTTHYTVTDSQGHEYGNYPTIRDAQRKIEELSGSQDRTTVHYLPFTPEMRDQAESHGFPLFDLWPLAMAGAAAAAPLIFKALAKKKNRKDQDRKMSIPATQKEAVTQ